MAQRAVEIIDEKNRGEEPPTKTYFDPENAYGESCGCNTRRNIALTQNRTNFWNRFNAQIGRAHV